MSAFEQMGIRLRKLKVAIGGPFLSFAVHSTSLQGRSLYQSPSGMDCTKEVPGGEGRAAYSGIIGRTSFNAIEAMVSTYRK